MRENTVSAARPSVSGTLRPLDPSHSNQATDRSAQELKPSTVETFELALTEPDKGSTKGRGTATTALQQLLDGPCVERPLTCEEAAAFVRVHPKTVKRLARRGDLPGHFRFGRWFFYASELDCWMRTELHSSRHSCR